MVILYSEYVPTVISYYSILNIISKTVSTDTTSLSFSSEIHGRVFKTQKGVQNMVLVFNVGEDMCRFCTKARNIAVVPLEGKIACYQTIKKERFRSLFAPLSLSVKAFLVKSPY